MGDPLSPMEVVKAWFDPIHVVGLSVPGRRAGRQTITVWLEDGKSVGVSEPTLEAAWERLKHIATYRSSAAKAALENPHED